MVRTWAVPCVGTAEVSSFVTRTMGTSISTRLYGSWAANRLATLLTRVPMLVSLSGSLMSRLTIALTMARVSVLTVTSTWTVLCSALRVCSTSTLPACLTMDNVSRPVSLARSTAMATVSTVQESTSSTPSMPRTLPSLVTLLLMAVPGLVVVRRPIRLVSPVWLTLGSAPN